MLFRSEIEQVKLGCAAGAGLEYVQLGIQTGKMAARVLKDEATCEEIPYEIIENYSLYVNSDVLKQLNIQLPEDIAGEAEDMASADSSAAAEE